MPNLYNQSGAAANIGTGPLAAGTYYLVSGPTTGGRQVQYYGNGTYYEILAQQYGGSTSNPNGTAGLSIGYTSSVSQPVGSIVMASGHFMAMMPTLYNKNGVVVNANGGILPAGYYSLSPSGTQIYYYGNGTYYNPSVLMYGGSVTNPNGTANVALGYSA
jgi:hypothetical protein